MKQAFIYLSTFVLALTLWQCSSDTSGSGFSISGNISDGANLQVFLDKMELNGKSNILTKADISESGSFSLSLPEDTEAEAGVYRVRVGAKRMNLALNGTEGKIKISGTLNDIGSGSAEISG